MAKSMTSGGYLRIGNQSWQFRRIETVSPDTLFDIDIRLDWGAENAVIYTQKALLYGLAPMVSAAEMEQLSEHEAAIVLEHVLSADLNNIEGMRFGDVAIQRVFFDRPASFARLPARARNETTTFRAEISNATAQAVLVICFHGVSSLGRFQTFLTEALSAGAENTPSPGHREDLPHADPLSPGLARVAIGPALLGSADIADVEPGDLIELNLPAAEAMDAVIIDQNGHMTRAAMQNGQLTILAASHEAPGGGQTIGQASGIYFEFAHAHDMPDTRLLRAAPFDHGLVNVLDRGRVRLRGRFMLEQERLAFIVDLIEPQS